MGLRVLGVIPARGGSKGVPRKNARLLDGKPLLAYTAEAAFAASRLTRVILSTDDEEIAGIGRSLGLEVPFMRPADLSADDTPMLPVVQHALRAMEGPGTSFDAVCLLQPTTPFRRGEDIDGCIELLETREADAVMTVMPVPATYNPHWVYFTDGDGSLSLATGETAPIPRRQSLPPAFHREGSVYVTRRDIVLKHNSLYGERLFGYVPAPGPRANIDSTEDWGHAERLLRDARLG